MIWAAVILLAAGFLVRRTLMPRALESLRQRPSPRTREVARDSQEDTASRDLGAPAPTAGRSARTSGKPNRDAGGRESLTESDRHELSKVLSRKIK